MVLNIWTNAEVKHYYESGADKAYRLRKRVKYQASARCGHGSPVDRLATTHKPERVTCEACQAFLPYYFT